MEKYPTLSPLLSFETRGYWAHCVKLAVLHCSASFSGCGSEHQLTSWEQQYSFLPQNCTRYTKHDALLLDCITNKDIPSAVPSSWCGSSSLLLKGSWPHEGLQDLVFFLSGKSTKNVTQSKSWEKWKVTGKRESVCQWNTENNGHCGKKKFSCEH